MQLDNISNTKRGGLGGGRTGMMALMGDTGKGVLAWWY